MLAYRADGSQLSGSPFGGLDKPLGIAVDSAGNKWVSNSHILDAPYDANAPPYDVNLQQDGSIALLLPDGSQATNSPFRGGGLTIPFGIAVDGESNVWVANFGCQRLSQFCGGDTSNCPPGLETGDPISPDTGYFFDGLQRNTGVGIDASGNVWLANNWKNEVNLTNPGGDGLVVFIGLAGPVQMPVIGPPQLPN